jgi:hypothetical protein
MTIPDSDTVFTVDIDIAVRGGLAIWYGASAAVAHGGEPACLFSRAPGWGPGVTDAICEQPRHKRISTKRYIANAVVARGSLAACTLASPEVVHAADLVATVNRKPLGYV